MLHVVQTVANNQNVFQFQNRGVEYTVVQDDLYGPNYYAVWTNRLNHSSVTPPRLLSTKDMIEGTTKVLREFATLITA